MAKSATTNAKVLVSKKGATKIKVKSSPSKKGNGIKTDVRILVALAQKKAMGENVVDRKIIQVMAGVDKDGSYKTTCGTIRTKGWIDYPDSNTLCITAEGEAQIPPELMASLPKTNEDVHTNIRESIKQKKSKEIFDFFTDGQPKSKAAAAAAVGYEPSAGSFKTYWGAVTKHLDKLDGRGDQQMFQLKATAFPFGGRPTMG